MCFLFQVYIFSGQFLGLVCIKILKEPPLPIYYTAQIKREKCIKRHEMKSSKNAL